MVVPGQYWDGYGWRAGLRPAARQGGKGQAGEPPNPKKLPFSSPVDARNPARRACAPTAPDNAAAQSGPAPSPRSVPAAQPPAAARRTAPPASRLWPPPRPAHTAPAPSNRCRQSAQRERVDGGGHLPAGRQWGRRQRQKRRRIFRGQRLLGAGLSPQLARRSATHCWRKNAFSSTKSAPAAPAQRS